MKRPRFSRMSFAGGLAVFAMIVLSGCAAGGDGATADWAPVARQTTGRYQRVCTFPTSAAGQAQAVTQSRGPLASPVAAALAPASPAFELRADDKMLSISLARWASMTGVAMRWMTPLQVPVTADSRVAGDLSTAMKSIFAAVTEAGYPLTILQVADGKTWIVTDANEFNSKPLFGNPSTNLAQAPKGASDAKAH
ncbi:TcpQ domain-containing protein [Burkholderia orbicola]|uniref:TcpQ domain-containing protein n=1 Tax=Burkholderia orbicola TaxID=2978683 RepID=UPI00264E8A67|nr:TcpQ domain-containing protein [Burkholderia orbicola]MDN7472565.1 TcpQ domain-containing protein [Burkholderia orbicola]MDN7507435.1 TcpQ domain-containing protein [Burkholderia orbicola]